MEVPNIRISFTDLDDVKMDWVWAGRGRARPHATPRLVIIINKKNIYIIRFAALRCVYNFKRGVLERLPYYYLLAS